MSKKSSDPHTKRQMQIRMDDPLRDRFDAMWKASGLTKEQFVEGMMDAYERRNAFSDEAVLQYLRTRLKAKG